MQTKWTILPTGVLIFAATAAIALNPPAHESPKPHSTATKAPTKAPTKPDAKPDAHAPSGAPGDATHDSRASRPTQPADVLPPMKRDASRRVTAPAAAHAAPHAAGDPAPTDADAALKLLREGNERWVNGNPSSPNTDASRRRDVADNGQKPFVTVLTCADSRLPVERLFDRGVGEVFVVRVAGNIAGSSEVGTIDYGVEHLKTPVLVVMGHTKCGAVAATAGGGHVHGKIADIVGAIAPAVDRARRNNPDIPDAALLQAAIKENVWQSIFDVFRQSAVCRDMASEGTLRVVGAVCDISTGKVEWLGEHPWQSELLDALRSREPSHEQAGAQPEQEPGH